VSPASSSLEILPIFSNGIFFKKEWTILLEKGALAQILHEENSCSYLHNIAKDSRVQWVKYSLWGLWKQSLFWDLMWCSKAHTAQIYSKFRTIR
jgi:hypothetical protein